MEIPAEIQLVIEREVAKARDEGRQEAEKARNQAIGVLAFVVLILSIASTLGITQTIKVYSRSAAEAAVKTSMGKEYLATIERAASEAERSSYKITRQAHDAAKLLSDLRLVEDWSEPKLEPNWRPFSKAPGLHNPPGYFKDPFGIVRLRGIVEGAGGTIFILPVGYRPRFREVFIAEVSETAGRVDVLSNGEVVLQLGDPTWVSLDSISFRVEREGPSEKSQQ